MMTSQLERSVIGLGLAPMSSKILVADGGYVLGQVGNLGIILWRTAPTVARVQAIRGCFSILEGTPGQGFGLLSVIEAGCPPPADAARKESDRTITEARDALLGFLVVIEAPGVLGAMARAFVRAANVVHRTPFPFRIAATVAVAAEELQHLLGARGGKVADSADITRAVACIRSQFAKALAS